jgi:hypothetical protein
MKFEVRIIANDPDMGPIPLRCKNVNNCLVTYEKQFSPVVYYLKPPVVYFESMVEMWFDPKSTQNLI